MLNRTLIIFSMLVVLVLLSVAGSNTSFGEETSRQTYLLGDADCSGEVNVVDALKALRYNVGLEEYSECMSLADADCDVDVDIKDVLAILRFDAGFSNPASNCVVGEAVPLTDPSVQVVDTSTFTDRSGRTYTLETVVPAEVTTKIQSHSGTRWCWSERWVKNAFGQKLATIRHSQTWAFGGGRITRMYTPILTHSSMLGWDVNNPQTQGPYKYDTWGYSYSTAEFKLKDPFLGWTLQSIGVYAGVTVRGDGTCSYWWG